MYSLLLGMRRAQGDMAQYHTEQWSTLGTDIVSGLNNAGLQNFAIKK